MVITIPSGSLTVGIELAAVIDTPHQTVLYHMSNLVMEPVTFGYIVEGVAPKCFDGGKRNTDSYLGAGIVKV